MTVARRACALLGAFAAFAGVAPVLAATARPDLIVVPRPRSRVALSYFKLGARPGHTAAAGAIEMRNPGMQPLRVALTAVDGQTLSTLGSGYAQPGGPREHAARWLRVGHARMTLAAHQRVIVPLAVHVPRGQPPGDYLAGVSVEALEQNTQSTPRKGVSIGSVDRYAIGVETSVPGPRHPSIRFTGAKLERQPAGLAFLLLAANRGNAILQRVSGRALITSGTRTVASIALGPGTFVTGTSIAYPIPTLHEHPRQGAVYRVRAYLRYRGGVARLDTHVGFGRAGALLQQAYSGARPRAARAAGLPAAMLALIAAATLALATLLALGLGALRRRRLRPAHAVLARALEASRRSGQPLSLISVTFDGTPAASAQLARTLRSRMRPTDRLCRLDDRGLLLIAADTKMATAEALADDARRYLERAEHGVLGLCVTVRQPAGELDARELLELLGEIHVEQHVHAASR